MFAVDQAWTEFLNSPIVLLEEYGLPLRTINLLEDRIGIYIRDLQAVSEEELVQRCRLMNLTQRQELRTSLLACYRAIQENQPDGL